MIRSRIAMALVLCLLAALSHSTLLSADVLADQKGRVEFAGMLGKLVNIFGGRAAREGVASSVAVKGDRMATTNEATGQIVDVAEEKVYDLDMKRKTYKVTTFDELRRRMEEARKKAEEDARKAEEKERKTEPAPSQPDKNAKEVDVDFNVKETGQKKTINGFDTREVVMTIAVREKGKTLDESGGLVLTSDMWMAPRIAAMKEIADFHVRYMRKLQGPVVVGASAEDMAAAMALYPMMKDAIARMNAENVKLDGTAIQTTVTMEAVKSAEQMAQEQKASEEESRPKASGGIGGMLGGLAARAAKKKAEGSADSKTDAKNRVTVMTMTGEVLKVTTDVTAADVAIPAGFQQK
jgi:hypothetical protein